MNEDLPDRIRNQFQRRERFTEAAFLGALASFKGNMQTGNLDLTFSVGVGEKAEALKVTDAPGELLLIQVTRISHSAASAQDKSR